MKYMIEFRVKPGQRDPALNRFEEFGPNRIPGVAFRGAWVGARSDIVYALVESDDETLVSQAAQSWNAYADSTVNAVIDIEEY